MLLTGLVLSMHTCSYCSGQEWQSHLGMCLLQGERSTPKEMTATHFEIVAAFTNQQWAPVPVLTLPTVMHHHCVLWKAKTHLLKNAKISHSATSREIPTHLTNTTEMFKITQYKRAELEERRTFGLTDLLFLLVSRIKEQIFHLPRQIPTQQWELLLRN